MADLEVSKLDEARVNDAASDSKAVVIDSTLVTANEKQRRSTTQIELWAFYIYYIVSFLEQKDILSQLTCV